MSRRSRRGANAIEFALLMPVFVGVVLGILDYAWLQFQLQGVATAVHSGCRSAATIDPGLNERDIGLVLARARTKMLAAYQQSGGTCAGCVATASAIGALPNRSVECTMSLPFTSLTGFVPAPARIEANVVARHEYQRRQQ